MSVRTLVLSLFFFIHITSAFVSNNQVGDRRLGKHIMSAANILDGFMSALRPNSNNNDNSKQFSEKTTTIDAPDWSVINELLRAKESPEERKEFEAKALGRGPTNHQGSIRLFDAPEGTVPEVTLFRDVSGWCPYSQKVWLQLEEKRIPYRVEKVAMRCYGEKPRSFMQMNPSGGIPVAIVKGRTIAESNDIMDALEKEFPSYKSLLPVAGSPASSRVTGLLQLERRCFSNWFRWLTASNGDARFAVTMDSLLAEVDRELQSTAAAGPFFLGAELSLVDVMYTPFLERMASSLPYYKGYHVRSERFPNLSRWFDVMDARPSYAGMKSDYYTHAHALPPQIGFCHFTEAATPYRTAIDGGDWSVEKTGDKNNRFLKEPLLPLGKDAAAARREVARNILGNQASKGEPLYLAKFCARALSGGKMKGPSVDAPLSDPNLCSNEQYVPLLDGALRHIVHHMLSCSEEDPYYPSSPGSNGLLPDSTKSGVKTGLEYLRDRISVPRDMSVHAAKQFRSHINLFIDTHAV